MNCEYCNTEFKSLSSLNYHKKNAKYCLKIRNKKNDKFQCKFCLKNLSTKFCLESHISICSGNINKIKEDNTDLTNENIYLRNEINNYKRKLREQENKFNERIQIITVTFEDKIEQLKEQEKEYKEQIKDLQNTLKDISLKSVSKSTTTNNKTQIINNYINNLKPLTEEHLAECSKHLTLEQIKRGASGYAEYALKYPFKDTVLCVDYSRHKIKMKDKDGHIITDPEMLTSSKMFFKSIFTRNKELLQEYSNEKEDVINKHGQDYADKLAFELLHYIADVSRGMEGEQSELQRNFVKEICSKKTV